MASEKKSPIGRRVKERSVHIYEVRPRKNKRGVALISDVLKYGAVWYTGPNAVVNAISGAKFQSQSQPGSWKHMRSDDETSLTWCNEPGTS